MKKEFRFLLSIDYHVYSARAILQSPFYKNESIVKVARIKKCINEKTASWWFNYLYKCYEVGGLSRAWGVFFHIFLKKSQNTSKTKLLRKANKGK